MRDDTDALIGCLAGAARRVEPLPAPALRAALWLALGLPYVALIVVLMGLRPDLSVKLAESRYLVEQIAAAATAVTAAIAAFSATIPGRARWTLALPLLPLAVWLGSLGQGCIEDVFAYGLAGLALSNDLICLPMIALVGFLPALLMAFMLRRGAPLYPHLAVALGGLAAAALGNVGLRLFHPTDASLMVLVWQVGSVALLACLAGLFGPLIHNWRRAQARL
jgi:hypothetical protein